MARPWIAAALLGLLTGAGPVPPLEPGPGSGFRTPHAPYLRALRAGVSLTPILTVGDSLLPNREFDPPFVFHPIPDGMGIRATDAGLVEVYVAHEMSWHAGLGGARVSRLLLNQRSLGVLAADYFMDGSEGYSRFCAATLLGPRDGFLTPTFLVNEESVDGPHHGVVVAIDARTGAPTELPWLGRFSHENTMVVPHSSGRIVAIATEDGVPGESQLYMYLADSDAHFLSGRGRLHVFRADPPSFGPNTGYASMATRTRPLTGRFVPIQAPLELPTARQPSELESRSRAAGALRFVRLEDAEPDRDRGNAFYFADTGDLNATDDRRGLPISRHGRVYRAELDPIDPTRVTELAVLLDGDEGDDLFRPDNLAADERGLMIQEDPGGRGIHPARILRYDTTTRRLEALAACAERDPQGRTLPEGTGGAWESTGIVDASEWFGEDAWLVGVQAPTIWETPFGGRGGGGQILLLRGPRAPRSTPQRRDRAAGDDAEGDDAEGDDAEGDDAERDDAEEEGAGGDSGVAKPKSPGC